MRFQHEELQHEELQHEELQHKRLQHENFQYEEFSDIETTIHGDMVLVMLWPLHIYTSILGLNIRPWRLLKSTYKRVCLDYIQ